jgi:hypothetical protein
MNEEVQYACATLAQAHRTLQERTEQLRKLVVVAASGGVDEAAATAIRETSKGVDEGGVGATWHAFLFFPELRLALQLWRMCATQWPWRRSWSCTRWMFVGRA